jgi:2-polyprenyl-3-methyl-5-hydroxy-6-metoxy-1,4-benzoquinol methylase
MHPDLFAELNARNPDLSTFNVHYDSRCVVCHQPAPQSFLGSVVDHEYTNTTSLVFPVYRCPNCQLTYLYPRPDLSELRHIYPPNYYAYSLSAGAPVSSATTASPAGSALLSLNASTYRQRILPFLKGDPSRRLRILDIGCGDGAQLDEMRRFFPNCETHGVDIDRRAIERAADVGHKVSCGRFEDCDLPADSFDLVYAIHVIEHVERPDLFLQRCLQALAPEGMILIETPNTDAVDFCLFKRRHWGGYHAPRHWYLFNIHTFRFLAQQMGAEIVAFGFYNTGVFWNWTCHSLCQAILGTRVAERLFPPVSIFYGGIQSSLILTLFAVVEAITFRVTGRGNALWIVLRKRHD